MVTLFIFVTLIGLILLGAPIAVSLGLTAVGFYVFQGDFRVLSMLPQRMFSATTGFTLLAIPFFILAGNLMNTGGITNRIFRFADACVGHIRGGLGQVNVLASLLFSGMSGAAVADAAGLGQVELKAMKDKGYDTGFSAAITAASSTIGPVFPPSIPFVLYSSITGVSVTRLFLAGVVPGILMAVSLMIAVWVVAHLNKMPRRERIDWLEIGRSFLDAILSLMTPIIIIFGIFGGLFTPTEAGVAASAYALVLSMLIYREVTIRQLPEILWQTLQHTIRVMFVIATAGFFGWMMVHQRVPNQLLETMLTVSEDPTVIIGIIVLVLLVLGMFLEGIAVIVLTVPLFLPIIIEIGLDPVQFGVIMIMCSMVGLLTPPVGMVLFAVSSIAEINVGTLSKALTPYLIGILIVLLLVIAVPAVSLWLPSMVVR
jgi:tripartite ATP-independent transporter DctM subunit